MPICFVEFSYPFQPYTTDTLFHFHEQILNLKNLNQSVPNYLKPHNKKIVQHAIIYFLLHNNTIMASQPLIVIPEMCNLQCLSSLISIFSFDKMWNLFSSAFRTSFQNNSKGMKLNPAGHPFQLDTDQLFDFFCFVLFLISCFRAMSDAHILRKMGKMQDG